MVEKIEISPVITTLTSATKNATTKNAIQT
jgi:hypothetical protein